MTQIPIFRAKLKNESEYVFGVPRQDSKGKYEMIYNTNQDGVYGVAQRDIDPSTLSINFPDMLDSQGNKIFASLSEDGQGGDICENESDDMRFVCVYKYMKMWAYEIGSYGNQHQLDWRNIKQRKCKIIGIQK